MCYQASLLDIEKHPCETMGWDVSRVPENIGWDHRLYIYCKGWDVSRVPETIGWDVSR